MIEAILKRDAWLPAAAYDLAVRLGAGLGGLAAAAAFANRGTRVLVLERLANFGDRRPCIATAR
jgi:flavin-dependent dehydrogenase